VPSNIMDGAGYRGHVPRLTIRWPSAASLEVRPSTGALPLPLRTARPAVRHAPPAARLHQKVGLRRLDCATWAKFDTNELRRGLMGPAGNLFGWAKLGRFGMPRPTDERRTGWSPSPGQRRLRLRS